MKNDSEKGGVGIGSILTGVAIGATAATLMHKSSRDKAKELVSDTFDRGKKEIGKLGSKVNKVKNKAKKVATTELKKTQKKLRSDLKAA